MFTDRVENKSNKCFLVNNRCNIQMIENESNGIAFMNNKLCIIYIVYTNMNTQANKIPKYLKHRYMKYITKS